MNYSDGDATTPLYRFYDVQNGSHFYTDSSAEVATVEAKWPTIYQFEGVAWSVALNSTNASPVYRFYDVQNGTHFYTASAAEMAMVEAKWPTIYLYEGIGFYIPN
jgi:hypothetical protein